ncbi:MAG: hypothetical protein P8X80_05580 [Desulfobacterales bacterium]
MKPASLIYSVEESPPLGATLLLAGISIEVMPGLYQNLSSWISPLFSSSLTMATITAFTLNLIFRIGVSQRASMELSPEIYRFLESQGAKWGARPQVIHEANFFNRSPGLGF